VIFVMVCALGVATWWGYHASIRMLADHWCRALAEAEDDMLVPQMRRIALLGDPGIERLIPQLIAPRPPAREAARRVLLEQVGEWENLAPAKATARMEHLARTLLEQSDAFNPSARQTGRDLALRILRTRAVIEAPVHSSLADLCLHVLARQGNEGSLPEDPQPGILGPMAFEHGSASGQGRPPSLTLNEDMEDALAGTPGGNLPIEPLPGPDPNLRNRSGGPNDPGSVFSTHDHSPNHPGNHAADFQPQPLLLAEEGVLPLVPRQMDSGEATPPDFSTSGDSGGASHSGEALPTALVGSSADPDRSALPGQPPAGQIERLLDELAAARGAQAALVVEKLRQAGFSELQLQLAQRLTDANPSVRVTWARYLPGMPGIRAHLWLQWLMGDPDAEVRLTAVSLLATTGDSKLLHNVIQRASAEHDPRVRAQVERIQDMLQTAQPAPRSR
jgi:hypothetical protein